MADPDYYLHQKVPGLPVPVRVAVVGPPKSGKSTGMVAMCATNEVLDCPLLVITVARRFVSEYGCLRLSCGEAMRRVIAQFPDSELTQQMLSYLKVGQTVPDQLCVMALERALLDEKCSTRG